MLKSTVLAHFGSGVAAARAIGLTKSAVSQWGEQVPLDKALKLQAVTKGALSVDMADYQLSDLSVRTHQSRRISA